MKKISILVFTLMLIGCLIMAFSSCVNNEEKENNEKGNEGSSQGVSDHTHTFDQKNTSADYCQSEATCTKAATYYYSCECGEKGTDTFTNGTALKHTYGTWKTVKAATCDKDGTQQRSCSCGKKETKTIVATGNHDFQPGVVEGYDEYNELMYEHAYICNKCNLAVAVYGNADGSIGNSSNCKYYITGDIVKHADYEIVVYGSGDMPNFSRTHLPIWYDYLFSTKKITIKEGITSIGEYCFYNSQSDAIVEYSIPNSVKTIKQYALGLTTKRLVLGNSVERLELNSVYVTERIYLPKSINHIDGFFLNVSCFYEGSEAEFYKIKTTSQNSTITFGEYFDMLDTMLIPGNFYVYVNAKDINDMSEFWKR